MAVGKTAPHPHEASRLCPLTRVQFSDRYCLSPLTVALLYRMLRQLKEFYGEAWGTPAVTVQLSNEPNSSLQTNVWEDWALPSEREKAARALLTCLGPVQVFTRDKKLMAHARSLRLEFKDGSTLTIWLDQGLGFLRAKGNDSSLIFPFRGSVEEQKNALMTMKTNVSVVQGGTIVSIKMSEV